MQEDEKYTSKLNKYPVIYITLKDVMYGSYEDMLKAIKTAVNDMYQEHRYLLESDKIYEEEKDKIKDILWVREDVEPLKISIKELSKYLYRQYDKAVILLIDEYDVPIQNAYVNGYYDEAIKFFKTFYGATFKDNPYLEKTVLTGVSRVAKESLFSGANNFDVYTVLTDEFTEDFEITKQEMKETIEHFGIEEDEEELKRWYDGYKIGNTENIYNPWSVLNYLNRGVLKPYWVNTSSNDLIKLILKNSITVKEKIEAMLESWFFDKVPMDNLRTILKDLTTKNWEEFEAKFERLVMEMFSFMDIGQDTAENFYHAFVLGMLVGLKDTYYVNSNRESGKGRKEKILE